MWLLAAAWLCACQYAMAAMVGCMNADADMNGKHPGSPHEHAAAAAETGAEAADAGDGDWAQSDDDGADDEATLDADEQAALADGIDVKVSTVLSSKGSGQCWPRADGEQSSQYSHNAAIKLGAFRAPAAYPRVCWQATTHHHSV